MTTLSDFKVLKPLSAGINGGNNRGVYLVKSKISKNTYIEKRVGRTHIKSGYAAREVRAMLQCISHPNIVFIKVWKLDYSRLGYGSIIMQHCELGSLDMLITQFERRRAYLPDEGFMWKVLWDISLALSFLSTGTDIITARELAQEGRPVPAVRGWNWIFHRDLKPGNIFLTWKDSLGIDKCPYPTAVLGDFGLSISKLDVRAGLEDAGYHEGGTPGFDLPEYPAYDETGDVYMLGLVVHCLARMRNIPVGSISARQLDPLKGMFWGGTLEAVVGKCLRRNSDKRPVPDELPMLVWRGYESWRKMRKDDGKKLPSWAFESNY